VGSNNLSPDGRLFAVGDETTKSLILWNVPENKQQAVLPGLKPPVAFAADGRSLVAVVAEESASRISVIDLTTLAALRMLTIPVDPEWKGVGGVCLSANGSYVTAENDSRSIWEGSRVHCWNVVTGALCPGGATGAHRAKGLLIGRNTLVAESKDASQYMRNLQWIDLETGAINANVRVERDTPWELSPDGRTVKVWVNAGRTNVRPAFYDAATGRHLGEIPTEWRYLNLEIRWAGGPTRWATDGRIIALGDGPPEMPVCVSEWQLWDVPPPRPLTWLVALAVGLALPFTGIAYYSVRRLRSLAGITP
jgi:WD40 repeat protein